MSDPAVQAVAALTILAAVLRFARLGHQGFWFDEGNTALLVHLSPGKMLGLIPQSESTPPLYYSVAWVWARIFGFGEAGLRSLSALAGVLVVPVAYGAAYKLVSRRAGVIAAALAACNPLLIWYSQEARSYELLVLLSGLSLLAFAFVLAEPRGRAVAGWVLASALALATHYYAILVVIPEAAWLLYVHRRERRVQVAIAVVAACGLALIPLALSQNGTGNANWIGKIALAPRLGQLLPQFLLGFGAPAQEPLQRLSEACVLVALAMLALRSADRRARYGALVSGVVLAAGLVLNLLLVAGGVDDLITRNVLALWLPAAVLVTAGLASPPALRSRTGLLGAGLAAAICVIGVIAAVGVASDRNLQRPDWRAVARALGPRPSAAGRVILIQDYRTLLPLSLYLKRLKFWRRQPSETVGEFDVVAISAPRVKLCWWGAACNLTPSKLQPVYSIPGFVEASRKRAYQFTIVRMLATHPVTLTRAIVADALTSTRPSRDGLILQR
jgi:4-amino-4-deoxy-L-arabinose transferase-like glycosyltransferase